MVSTRRTNPRALPAALPSSTSSRRVPSRASSRASSRAAARPEGEVDNSVSGSSPGTPPPSSPRLSSGAQLPGAARHDTVINDDTVSRDLTDILNDTALDQGTIDQVLLTAQRGLRRHSVERTTDVIGQTANALSRTLARALNSNSRIDRLEQLSQSDSMDLVKACNHLRKCSSLAVHMEGGTKDFLPALHAVRDTCSVERIADITHSHEPSGEVMSYDAWRAFCADIVSAVARGNEAGLKFETILSESPAFIQHHDDLEKSIRSYSRTLSAAKWYSTISPAYRAPSPDLQIFRWTKALPHEVGPHVQNTMQSLADSVRTLQRAFDVTRNLWPRKRTREADGNTRQQRQMIEQMNAISARLAVMESNPAPQPSPPAGPPPFQPGLLGGAPAAVPPVPIAAATALPQAPYAPPHQTAHNPPQPLVAGTGKTTPYPCRRCPGKPVHSLEDCPIWLAQGNVCHHCNKPGHVRKFCPYLSSPSPNGARRWDSRR